MTDRAREVRHTHIGGQAVIEGVMMRGRLNWALAVRVPDGSIHVEEHDLRTASARHAWLRKPIIRGVWGLWETLSLAMRALSISAELAGETEEEKLTPREVAWTMAAGVGLAIGLFIVLPAVVTGWLVGSAADRPFEWNLVDGLLRLVAFFAYIVAVSRMREIERVFAYHGAEHKTIHAYERGLPLDAEVIQRHDTMHVRCGTSFLLMVMVLAIAVYSLVPIKGLLAAAGLDADWAVLGVAIAIRLLLLPLIAGLAYEVIKWAGARSDAPAVRVLLWPGLMLQKLTTREPDDGMVEVAVEALKLVVAREEADAAVGQRTAPDDRAETVLADAP